MKNLISSLFLLISIFSVSKSWASDCNANDLKVKLSELKFLEMPFTDVISMIGKPSTCTVVKIKNWQPGNGVTQAQGTTECKKLAKQGERIFAINPGNPQYGKENLGNLGDNTLGYYFCMQGANKNEMCTRMQSSPIGKEMVIRYASKTKGGDGDCLCKKIGDSSEGMSCPANEKLDALKKDASTGCGDPSAAKDALGECKCKTDSNIAWKTGVKCPEENAVVAKAIENDEAIGKCLAEIKEAKEECSDKGRNAIAKCSKEAPEVNRNISEAQRVMSIGLDAIIAKNANTGALDACTKMSVAGTGMIAALGLLQKTCRKEIAECRQSCEQVKTISEKTEEQLIEDCQEKLGEENPLTEAQKANFAKLMKVELDAGITAEKFCSGDVQMADNNLESLLQELGTNVQQADICRCQLTASSNGTSCDEINSPLTCIQNVNQPGCSFSTVGCTPGSTLPNCINPISAINPNGSGVNMPASGFAGPGFASGGGGTVNNGKVGIGDGDLSGLFDETRPSGSGTATADAGSPFGTAAAASSGGGGGGGSGGGGTEGGTGEGGDEKDRGGLSGLFQSAKGGLANLFGGGADGKSTGAKKPDNKAYKNDVNAFRPKSNVRGMANSPELGGKNRDIWKTMNERYNDQYHTFITVETPPQK